MKVKVIVVSGPCKDVDEYVFRYEYYEAAIDFAADWLGDQADLLTDVGDKFSIDVRVEEWEEEDLPVWAPARLGIAEKPGNYNGKTNES